MSKKHKIIDFKNKSYKNYEGIDVKFENEIINFDLIDFNLINFTDFHLAEDVLKIDGYDNTGNHIKKVLSRPKGSIYNEEIVEAKDLYDIFGWNDVVDMMAKGYSKQAFRNYLGKKDKLNDDFRPYTMLNDFIDVYEKLIYSKYGGSQRMSKQEFLKKYDEYSEINSNEDVQKFALLTNTVGNFSVIPMYVLIKSDVFESDEIVVKNFNEYRKEQFDNNWVSSLQVLKDMDSELFELCCGGLTFNEFVEEFKLADYNIDNKLDKTLLEGVSFKSSTKEILHFIRKINTLIEKRNNELSELYKLKS